MANNDMGDAKLSVLHPTRNPRVEVPSGRDFVAQEVVYVAHFVAGQRGGRGRSLTRWLRFVPDANRVYGIGLGSIQMKLVVVRAVHREQHGNNYRETRRQDSDNTDSSVPRALASASVFRFRSSQSRIRIDIGPER